MRADEGDAIGGVVEREAFAASRAQHVDRTGGPSELAVAPLASAALAALAARVPKTGAARMAQRVEALCDALRLADDARLKIQTAQLGACGVSADELVEAYAPAAAQRLGDLWIADELSFAEVSIATARLQEIVRRRVGGRRGVEAWLRPRPAADAGVLIVAPDFEQHTLGSFVAASQMRRLGAPTSVRVGLPARDIAKLTRERRFSVIGLSISSRRNLGETEELVDRLRTECRSLKLIGLGGWVAKLGEAAMRERTGADFVAGEPSRLVAAYDALTARAATR